jgi:glycosyltransferase involved in cell wall biosynthesis
MKTVCVMDSVSRANGGIFEAERKLQQHLHALGGIDVRVVGLQDEHTDADRAAWAPLEPLTLPVQGPRTFGYAPGFVPTLEEIGADLAYSVGLWKGPSLAVLQWAKRTGKPYLVAPHGMLDPWALRNSGAKKKVAAWLFQNEQLRRASCLRALCASEVESMRAYGLKNPICVIPNGIDLPDEMAKSRPSTIPDDKKVLLYLGRLHPKKGLVPLLTAWSNARPRGADWVLAIAGWDQNGHEAELKWQANALGLGDTVRFLGPQFGSDKEAWYRACDAFVLPSFSEGLPMVVLEAWAYAKPVLLTTACNLPEGPAAGAALCLEPNAESLTAGLGQLFAMSTPDLHAMGRRGRELAENRFAWPRLAVQMESVYKWMLGSGARPDCVQGG